MKLIKDRIYLITNEKIIKTKYENQDIDDDEMKIKIESDVGSDTNFFCYDGTNFNLFTINDGYLDLIVLNGKKFSNLIKFLSQGLWCKKCIKKMVANEL